MKGRHEKESGRTGARKRKKNIFADVVVSVCVVVALLVTGGVMWEYHRLGEVMPSGVVTALYGFWGGELLIVALRQIFGSDVTRRNTTVTDDTEETDDSDIFGGSI